MAKQRLRTPNKAYATKPRAYRLDTLDALVSAIVVLEKKQRRSPEEDRRLAELRRRLMEEHVTPAIEQTKE